MKYNFLNLSTNKKPTRKGRGIAAGKGKTAGRGTKGQGSRKSGGVRPGFEGGQMPLYMRIPKLRGFKSHRNKIYSITTTDLNKIKSQSITLKVLSEYGYIPNEYVEVKIIAGDELNKKMSVEVQYCSKGAKELIEKSGGKINIIDRLKRPKKNK